VINAIERKNAMNAKIQQNMETNVKMIVVIVPTIMEIQDAIIMVHVKI
jgi:hypothetical protein